MRSLRLSALVVLLVAACAEQNTPVPDNSDGAGADSGSGGGGKTSSGGKASTGGSVATGGNMANKAGSTSTAGKTSGGGDTNAGGDNAGGEPSSAGTGGSGGKASGGAGGKGGSGGSGGSGGKGGSGGAGGSGGSGCKPSPSGPIGGISARYEPEKTGASGTSIGSKLIIANIGPNTVDLGTLKLRYYLTNEVSASVQTMINWAYYRPNAGGGQMNRTVTMSLNSLACTGGGADSYLEFTFNGAGNLEVGYQVYFSWAATNTATQNFNQANDYSFDAAAKETADDTKVVVLKTDGTLVWGNEP
jgi:Cellulose binding domain